MAAGNDVEAVCFDLDRTLCVSDQSDAAIHAAVYERVGVDPFFAPADVGAVGGTDLPTADSDRHFYELLYREAASIAGVDPDPDLFTDLATATVDVVGAHAAGLQSAWVPYERQHETLPTDPDPVPTHPLDSMHDLLTVI